jgi:signal peptidase I
MDENEGRVVLRRGMVEHGWREQSQPLASARAARAPALPRLPRLSLPRVLLPEVRVPKLVQAVLGATLGVLLVLVAIAFSFRGFEARGESMEPGLHDGARLIVARIVYEEVDLGLLDWLPLYDSSDLRWGSPGRGDVIVFDSPVRNEQLVKRVIGLPGDTVRIKGGAVYVNGERLDEPYAMGETDCLKTCEDIEVAEGQFFVLGDNREDSVDSRQGWTVARDKVTGRVLFSY